MLPLKKGRQFFKIYLYLKLFSRHLFKKKVTFIKYEKGVADSMLMQSFWPFTCPIFIGVPWLRIV